MDLNSCLTLNPPYVTIAYYSHLVPILLSLFLSVYAIVKTKFSKLSIVFFAFTSCFSLWLAGDLIAWTQGNYNLIASIWSWLDYINIIFFVLGVYFYGLLAKDKLNLVEKSLLILIPLPAAIISILGKSIINFYQPLCEATNYPIITYYKLISEWVVIIMLVHFLFVSLKNVSKEKRKRNIIIFLAMLSFYAVFGSTEYIASITGIYEINLYGLFILPVFLLVMVFSMTNLGLFQFRLVGTQILTYTLVIIVGSQYIFLQSSTRRTLSLITLSILLFLGLLLIQNARREIEQREKIEKLAKDLEEANGQLKELDQMKSEFLSLATHQIRAPLTAIKGYSSMLLEGDFGVLPQKAKDSVDIIMKSCQNLINIVGDFLDISRIEQGRMTYNMETIEATDLILDVVDSIRPNITNAGLKLNFDIGRHSDAKVSADRNKLKQVIGNLVDNAIKYTPKGSITIALNTTPQNVLISITDTGVGISKEEMAKLFNKFTRAKDANKTNVIGTGLGLYIAKKMVEAHHGDIKINSEGEGKGSTFTIELPRY